MSTEFKHSSIEIESILIHHGLGFHFILFEIMFQKNLTMSASQSKIYEKSSLRSVT